ncbi:phosphoglycerate mutase-like protein [Thozetella sp. PMI_491]|nr:phosphoglycerate mutase-like protein [Thozetella sp. PMI_491]
MSCTYHFSSIPGVFQDYVAVAKSQPDGLVRTLPSLGLVERPYSSDSDATSVQPQWLRFQKYIEHLNHDSLPGESYKLLFVMRHGLGVHNVAMARLGHEAWKSHWSHLDGDGQVMWLDAKLVDEGVKQAKEVGRFLGEEVQNRGMPLPSTIYCSPLARCLETTRVVYEGISTSIGGFRPMVKELLRERLTDHTCDKRSSRSWIEEKYPTYVIEASMTENDELWQKDRYESAEEHAARKQQLLEDIFAHDEGAIIALVTHSYAISALLDVVEAPKYRVAEGVMTAMLVKAVKLGQGQ